MGMEGDDLGDDLGDDPDGGADAPGNGEGEGDKESDNLTLADMPPSWVTRLHVPRDLFQSRCPSGHKRTTYRKGTLEKCAPYSREDGLIERITLYEVRTGRSRAPPNQSRAPPISRELPQSVSSLMSFPGGAPADHPR